MKLPNLPVNIVEQKTRVACLGTKNAKSILRICKLHGAIVNPKKLTAKYPNGSFVVIVDPSNHGSLHGLRVDYVIVLDDDVDTECAQVLLS